jgi:hypothetical protein
MRKTIILGAIALAMITAPAARCAAAGAVAIGLPSDVARQGVSMGDAVNSATMDDAK